MISFWNFSISKSLLIQAQNLPQPLLKTEFKEDVSGSEDVEIGRKKDKRHPVPSMVIFYCCTENLQDWEETRGEGKRKRINVFHHQLLTALPEIPNAKISGMSKEKCWQGRRRSENTGNTQRENPFQDEENVG